MTADYVAIEAGPLRHLAGRALWYIQALRLIGVAFVLASWLALRRWLREWTPLLAYILFLYLAMGLVKIVTDQRLETIPLATPLDSDETKQLESAVGEPVMEQRATNQPLGLIIRRDPQVHQRAIRWLQEHGR